MKKKFLITLILCILVLAFTGCTSQQTDNEDTTEQNDTTSGFIEIVDQNGMTALVPENASRVVLTALPLPSIYAITGAPIENLVGMHPGSTSAIENSVMAAMYPELLQVPSNFIDGTDINIEELLKLDPDVVIYWAEYSNQYDALSAAGIPAVGVKTQAGGDALATMESWLEIMGQMFGTTGNTEKVLEYGRQVQQEIADQVGSGYPGRRKAACFISVQSQL